MTGVAGDVACRAVQCCATDEEERDHDCRCRLLVHGQSDSDNSAENGDCTSPSGVPIHRPAIWGESELAAIPSTMHCVSDDVANLLRRFDKVRIDKVGVVRRGAVSAMPEESTDERQTFARHDCLTCGGMAQVVQAQAAELRIRADRAPARDEAGLPPRLGVARKQVRIRVARMGQRGDVRPRGCAERHGARASLRVAKVDGVGPDIAPAQCCFSESVVGSPRQLVAVFRSRIYWKDGAIR